MASSNVLSYVVAGTQLVFFSMASAKKNESVSESNIAELNVITVNHFDFEGYSEKYSSSSTGLRISPKHTPKSTFTVTNDFIKDKQLQTVDSIIENTPGISVDQQDGSSVIYFSRGFEIESYQIDGMAVDFFADKPMGDAKESSAIFDKVEVVKGSNGLMKGAGKPSASINFIRKKADVFDFSGSVSLYGDSFGNIGSTVDIGSKLNPTGTLRTRVIMDGDKGNTHLEREKEKRHVVYGVVEADLTDTTLLTLGARQRKNTTKAGMSGALPAFYEDRSETDWAVDKSSGVDWQKNETVSKEIFATFTQRFNNDWEFKLQANSIKNTGSSKSFFINDYAYDDPSHSMNYSASKNDRESSQKNIHAQASGNFTLWGQTHQAMLGLQYSKYDITNYNFPITGRKAKAKDFDHWDGSLEEPSWSDSRRLNYNTKMTEKAINGSVKFQLTDAMSGLLGGRLTHYDVEHTQVAYFGSMKFANVAESQYNNVFTPFLGLTYDVSDNYTLFASYTDIFEPQYLLDRNGQLLDPIEGENIEAGLKFGNDKNSLQAQLSFFYIKQDNLSKRDIGYTVPGTSDWAFIGTKGTVSKGFDIELSGELSPQWRANVGYTQFKVRNNVGERHNPEEPQKILKVFTTYEMEGALSGLTIGGGLKWYGDRYTTARFKKAGAPWYAAKEKVKYNLSDYAVIDVMAKYKINKHSSVQINVDNVLNKKYKKSQHSNNFISGQPRSIMARFTYQF